MSTSSNSTLTDLVALIAASVEKINATCTERALLLPALDAPFNRDAEAVRMDPRVLEATSVIVAAAAQLVATVRSPTVSLQVVDASYATTAALTTINKLHVSEIVGRAGPQGVDVKEIGAKTGTDPQKIGRLLRLLATQHVFREVSPDVFTHNRISSLLDTGKTYETVVAAPNDKYDNANGIGALTAFGDLNLKSAAALYDTLTDPATAFSNEPRHAAVSRALGVDPESGSNTWDFMDGPENEGMMKAFGAAMASISELQPDEAITHGFDFGALPNDSLVVDVGGGVGSVSLVLAKAFPHLRIVIEDRAPTVAEGAKYWAAHLPAALPSGRAQFLAHDFFDAQPAALPAVPAAFIMRRIAHDWSDAFLAKIYRRLRDAAGPETQLVVIEAVLPYACAQQNGLQIKGAEAAPAPRPLLPNLGAARVCDYAADFMMMTFLNAAERTLTQHADVLRAGGWKLVEKIQMAGHEMWHPHLVATPI